MPFIYSPLVACAGYATKGEAEVEGRRRRKPLGTIKFECCMGLPEESKKYIGMGRKNSMKCLARFTSSPGEGKQALHDSPRTAARPPLRRGTASATVSTRR